MTQTHTSKPTFNCNLRHNGQYNCDNDIDTYNSNTRKINVGVSNES